MTENIEYGASTTKLAAISLDWSIISAKTIHKCVVPFLTNADKLESVKIYMTKFGKERIEQEEKHGPLIQKPCVTIEKHETEHKNETIENNEDAEQDDTKENNEIDDAQAKKKREKKKKKAMKQKATNEGIYNYNKERKMYYIAILQFTDVEEAENIYKMVDGLEIEDTNNYFDLRFVSDYEVFDCVDACNKDNEYEEICKNNKEGEIGWEDDTRREQYMASLFDKEEIESDIVNNLIDLSGEDEQETREYDAKEYAEQRNKETKQKDAKKKKKKSKKEKKTQKTSEKEVKIDLQDARFAKVIEDEDFAVDVTHNLYKSNESLKEIVKEKRKKRKTEE